MLYKNNIFHIYKCFLRQSLNRLFNIRLYQMTDIMILIFILLQLLQLYPKSLYSFDVF